MIRSIRRLLVALLLLVGYSFQANAETPDLHRFFLDYAVVKHSLKNDQGVFDELIGLRHLNPHAADFLVEFWWTKAKKECNDYMYEVAKRYSEKETADTSKAQKEKLHGEATKEVDQCFYGVYYDNWDEINRMILQNYKNEQKDQRTK